MQLRIGCSSWTSAAWWGRVYPERIRDGDRLAWYARFFDTVEVDSTYYRAPPDALLDRWAAVTPPEFLFTLKFPRDLLDPKRPVERAKVDAFLAGARRLGGKLGPILLQFPPWVKPGRATAYLEDLLAGLDPGLRYAVELRDIGWYRGPAWDRLRGNLRDLSIALAWSYLTYLEVPAELTSDFVYLRFIGDHTSVPESVHGELRVDRSKETHRWAERVKEAALRVRSTFAFFNNHYAGFAPESANRFREEMGLRRVEWEAGVRQTTRDGAPEGA